ncbi:MAG: Cof-type HAD-IIB family hydrolase [Lachnospiraceae bacterium]|nr:Cof-type HAD-IIB family hydrolase [Lachnospiraceae bacterium]
MNSGRKILFTDLDGTLLSKDKSVSPKNLEAIERMTREGHKFVIVTGRPLFSAIRIARSYNWYGDGYYISSYNGGLVYDCHREKNIITHRVSVKDIKYILDAAHAAGLHAHTYDDKQVVSEYATEEFERYKKGINESGIVVDDITTYLKEDPIKAIVVSFDGREKLVDFRRSIADYTDGRLAYTFSNPTLLEYSSLKATKGASLEYLAGILSVPMENTIACGDEENDRSMIETAGIGVLMKNGNEKLMDVADYVTENDNDNDGIAEVINKFIFNE